MATVCEVSRLRPVVAVQWGLLSVQPTCQEDCDEQQDRDIVSERVFVLSGIKHFQGSNVFKSLAGNEGGVLH